MFSASNRQWPGSCSGARGVRYVYKMYIDNQYIDTYQKYQYRKVLFENINIEKELSKKIDFDTDEKIFKDIVIDKI